MMTTYISNMVYLPLAGLQDATTYSTENSNVQVHLQYLHVSLGKCVQLALPTNFTNRKYTQARQGLQVQRRPVCSPVEIPSGNLPNTGLCWLQIDSGFVHRFFFNNLHFPFSCFHRIHGSRNV